MSPQVLMVSRDDILLHTRQLILGAFFEVRTAGRMREAEELISRRRFDLIVLCYTLSEKECRQVLDLIAEQKPRPSVLMLTALGSRPAEPQFVQVTMTEAGPYYLLKKSAELLGVDIKSKANVVGV